MLKNHRFRIIELQGIEERIDKLESTISNVKAQKLTDEPKGGEFLDLTDRVIQLADLKNHYHKMKKQIEADELKVEAKIRTLEYPIERTIARHRYLDLLDWDEISDKVKYSERHVRRINGRILQKMSADVL